MRLAGALMCAGMLWLTACEPQPVRTDAGFITIDNSGWGYGRSYEFTPSLSDSVGRVEIAIAIRHNNDYPYSNLWLELTSPIAGSDSVRTDTFDVAMADVYGHWYGHGSSMSYVLVDTLPEIYHYDVERPFRLRHIMRVDTVTDITQIGLIFNQVK